MSEDLEGKIKLKKPIRITLKLKAGKKYSICTCGHSKNLPFCDNTHREINAEKGTNYRSLKITPHNNCVIYLSSKTWRD